MQKEFDKYAIIGYKTHKIFKDEDITMDIDLISNNIFEYNTNSNIHKNF